ncbi:MAG: hypothetical protein AAGA90_20465 [Actinomycetota bacterium]
MLFFLLVVVIVVGPLVWRRWRWLLVPGWREIVVATADGRMRVRAHDRRGWFLVAANAPGAVWRAIPAAGFLEAVAWESSRRGC